MGQGDRMLTVAWVTILGCATDTALPTIVLDGESEVRVQSLGPVDGPSVVLPDGVSASEVQWTVYPEGVARLTEGGVIEAVGPGDAVVQGSWRGQTVSWTLVVEPAIVLLFRDAPAQVPVGQVVNLQVEGRLDDRTVDTGALTWGTSDMAIADINPQGMLTATAPGVVYVTASSPSGEAMVEIRVVTP